MARLRIGIVQAGRLLEERTFAPGGMTIGQSLHSDVIVPADALPQRWRLFERTRGGCRLRLPEGASARIAVDRAVQTIAADAPRTVTLLDRPGTRGRVSIGDVAVLFQLLGPAAPRPRAQLPHGVRAAPLAMLDRMFAVFALASLLAHAGFVQYLRSVDWPRAPEIEELPDTFVRQVIALPRPPAPAATAEPAASAAPATPAPRPRGTPRANAAPSRGPSITEQVKSVGLMKVLGSLRPGEGAIADLLAPGDVDRDQERAFQGVTGVSVAANDTGLRGVRREGRRAGDIVAPSGLRGDADIRVATTNVGPTERRVRSTVAPGAPAVDGQLDPGVVGRVVKDRVGALRSCYERALKRRPGLSGKIVLRWTITAAGTVAALSVDEDTMGDPDVVACIRAHVATWRFPAPVGGTVEVSFPFVFQAGQ